MPILVQPGTSKHPGSRRLSFASKEELLAYANRIRQAGGADALDALLPAKAGDAKRCLIARALNFGCTVGALTDEEYTDGSYVWYMETPDADTTRRLACAMRARTLWITDLDHKVSDEYPSRGPSPARGDRLVMLLPKRIGNAAHAFDDRHPEFKGLRR